MKRPIEGPETLAASGFDVSRETQNRLVAYVEMLRQWQARINLISPATLGEIWSRHILDSVQIFHLRPEARLWVDIGSGGGLPGLVIACFLAETAEARIHLVESNGKKAAFLRHVAGSLALPAEVHLARIEDCLSRLPRPEIITARALAPLDQLLGYTNLLLKTGVTGLFPKGREFEEELTTARQSWHFSSKLHPSVTDRQARILEISME